MTKKEKRFMDKPIKRIKCLGIVNTHNNYFHYLTEVESKGHTEHICLVKGCSNFGGEIFF